MALFKYKPNRNKYLREIKTLDELHKEKITMFDERTKSLPAKKDLLKTLIKKMNRVENKYKKDPNSIDINKRSQLKTQILTLQNEINMANLNTDMLDYFEKTGDILIKYYSIDQTASSKQSDIPDEIEINDNDTEQLYQTEQQSNDENDNNDSDDSIKKRLIRLNELSKKDKKVKKAVRKRQAKQDDNASKSISILSFFNVTAEQKKEDDPNIEIIQDKASLKTAYISLIDNDYIEEKIKVSPIRYCNKCGIEKTLRHDESIFVCHKCGEVETVLMDSEIPSHKDALNEKPKYPYKKINHLIEKLNQFQSKETTVIPQEVYEKIDSEIKKQRLDRKNITPKKIKDILRKHKLSNYYEHHHQIFSKVTGTPPPLLTRETEEKIKNMFKDIQFPFKKYCPKDRSNFLNYSYVLHKIFLILELPNNAKYFPLLKSTEKLRVQDGIWEKICTELGWTFHSSD